MLPVSQTHFNSWLDLEQRTKGVDVELTQRLSSSLRSGLETHYQAVAADIDGTLTDARTELPSRGVMEDLRTLLLRGIRIIFVTGRGTTAESVIRQLLLSLGEEPFSLRYLRRVHCLIDNGATALEWTKDDTPRLRARSLARLSEPEKLLNTIRAGFTRAASGHLTAIRVRPERIRIEFNDVAARDDGMDAVAAALGTSNAQTSVAVARGVYRNSTFTIDLTPTTKGRALATLCGELGVPLDRCLRLGDQGTPDGNDFDFLDAPTAFSVDRFSDSPDGCHIVVGLDGKKLKNTSATSYLLRNLHFSTPLASAPIDVAYLRGALAEFERDVHEEAQRQMTRTVEQFSTAAGRLFSKDREVTARHDLAYLCYDRHSGAVRLEHIEALSPTAGEPLGQLFRLDEFDCSSRPPRSGWSMYTDSAVILRGPYYYWEWTRDQEESEVPISEILRIYCEFTGRSLTGIAVQTELPPSILRFKLLLGVLDTVRDILLKVTHLAFAFHSEIDAGPDISLITDISSLNGRHTEFMTSVHIDNSSDWDELHAEYFTILAEVHDSLLSVTQLLKENEITVYDSSRLGQRLFRSRECDWFLENLAACQMGLEKHTQQHSQLRDRAFGVLGLVYGGIELPFICRSLGRRLGLEVIPGLVSASSYTRMGIRNDPAHEGLFALDLNEWISDRDALHPHGSSTRMSVLLADDNMTTARSLQQTWDALEDANFEVLGSIIVRYPGLNRFVQMTEIDKSVPDPELFMSFVRGLVSPAPYARRVGGQPGSNNPYLDATGTFNKMDDRLRRYLAKAASIEDIGG